MSPFRDQAEAETNRGAAQPDLYSCTWLHIISLAFSALLRRICFPAIVD